jgi:hypothetical protein
MEEDICGAGMVWENIHHIFEWENPLLGNDDGDLSNIN